MQSIKNMSKARRILSFAIAVIIVLSGIVFPSINVSSASYQDQISALEEKQRQIKNQISELQNDINKQNELKSTLQAQINNVQAQIDIYDNRIAELDSTISENEAEKQRLTESLEQRKKTFLERIRAMYVTGNTSSLSLILSADDYGDFLYKYELISKVTEYDNDAMEQMKADIVRVDELTAQVQSEKDEQETLKSDVVAKRRELDGSMNSLNSILYGLQDKKSELNDKVKAYQDEIDSLEAKIKEAANSAKNDTEVVYDGAQFINPLGSFKYIVTSEYGPRWGKTHKGLDLAGSGIYGAKIYAAADGVVILSGNSGNGYGNYVMINHGNGSDGNNYTTLYGHCSSLAVSVGQTVKAGDVIAYVGSTGYSTGPHLHFEIRVNGSAVNPRRFRSF